MFLTLLGCWVARGGSPKEWVHNLLMQLFTLGSSKFEVLETYFYDTVITQYDHPRDGLRGGGLPRNGYTTCLCSFSPWAAQNSKFWKLIFMIL